MYGREQSDRISKDMSESTETIDVKIRGTSFRDRAFLEEPLRLRGEEVDSERVAC